MNGKYIGEVLLCRRQTHIRNLRNPVCAEALIKFDGGRILFPHPKVECYNIVFFLQLLHKESSYSVSAGVFTDE